MNVARRKKEQRVVVVRMPASCWGVVVQWFGFDAVELLLLRMEADVDLGVVDGEGLLSIVSVIVVVGGDGALM